MVARNAATPLAAIVIFVAMLAPLPSACAEDLLKVYLAAL